MPLPDSNALGHEWAILQNNHEQYERSSLLIKLAAIALFLACLALSLDVVIAMLLLIVVWVQEAIFRTSQSRLGARIVRIEQLIREGRADAPGYQLHSEWLATRPGTIGLLAEYGSNLLRPTIAFPYAVLMAMMLVWFFAA